VADNWLRTLTVEEAAEGFEKNIGAYMPHLTKLSP